MKTGRNKLERETRVPIVTHFLMYTDNTVKEWQNKSRYHFQRNHITLDTVLFADDKAVTVTSEEDLHLALHTLNIICTDNNF
jgi:hypothetical protein